MATELETAPVEVPEILHDWHNQCPICGDNLQRLGEQPAGVMRYQCLGCGEQWWHSPGKGIRNTPTKW